jgi:hypothetical protein
MTGYITNIRNTSRICVTIMQIMFTASMLIGVLSEPGYISVKVIDLMISVMVRKRRWRER